MFLSLSQSCCPFLENVERSGARVKLLTTFLENTFRYETIAENGDKNELITKEIWFSED